MALTSKWFTGLFAISKRFNGNKRNSISRLMNKDIDTVSNSNPNNRQKNLSRQVFPVVAACTAESYDFSRLLPFLQKNYQLSPFICDEVLHAQIPAKKSEIFFFKNGSLVFWSGDAEISEEAVLEGLKESLLPIIKNFEMEPFKEPDFEGLSYKIVSNQR